jgi:hypothetical protein
VELVFIRGPCMWCRSMWCSCELPTVLGAMPRRGRGFALALVSTEFAIRRSGQARLSEVGAGYGSGSERLH